PPLHRHRVPERVRRIMAGHTILIGIDFREKVVQFFAECAGDLKTFVGVLSAGRSTTAPGGFVRLTYLRMSQCRCIASIRRSSSRIEVWVWRTRPGSSFASLATAWVISGRLRVPFWTFL